MVLSNDTENGVKVRRKSNIRDANRKVILAAAEDVFAEQGFGGATMAEIAQRASLPKANLHYYFGTKEDLYKEVIHSILIEWSSNMAKISANDAPREAIGTYVRSKMEFSRTRPAASKVFAAEMMRGAPILQNYLTDVHATVAAGQAVIDRWVNRGLMPAVDGRHAFMMLWAVTQHYADFEVQVRAILGKSRLTRADWQDITAKVETLILRSLGL